MVKNNITFIEDIAEEVAEEHGITPEQVIAVYNMSVKYTRQLMEEDDCFAITIPFIGTMHINKGSLFKSIKSQQIASKVGYRIDEEKYYRNVNKMKVIEDLEKRRKEEGLGEKPSHSKKTILRMLKKKTGKSLEEIEEIQKEKNG
jgi:hypothetical protein